MPTPTPTETPTVTPTLTVTPTPTVTPVHEDIFYVSENAFRPSAGGSVSIYVGYTNYPGPYSLKIYNSAGEQVKTLDPDQVITEAKYASYSWDGKNESQQDCASGIYVLYLIEPLDRKIKRVMLIR
jgi:flagellar hook assembly protein FlgD